MTFKLDLSTIVSLAAIAGAFFAFWQYRQQKKEIAVQEGKNKAEQDALKGKLEAAEKKISKLEDRAHCTDIDISEMKKDIKFIAETVRDLKEIFKDIAPNQLKDTSK